MYNNDKLIKNRPIYNIIGGFFGAINVMKIHFTSEVVMTKFFYFYFGGIDSRLRLVYHLS